MRQILYCNNQYVVLYLSIQIKVDYHETSDIINEGG